MVPSSEGRENFPEAVPVIAEIPLVLPSSEGRRKLGTTGTTVWFTVEYCQFPYDSRRGGADNQMRRRFTDLRQILAIPVLHGVSAFGIRLSFYEYDSATYVVQPEQVLQSHPSIFDDVAPITRWDCDVLQQEGANRLRKVVNQVKEMCARV